MRRASLWLLDEAARPPVAAFLQVFAAGLPRAASARRRADLVAELGDGLVDDVTARIALGVPARRAALDAVAEFGDPRRLARDCAEELAAGAARRTCVALLSTGPLVGLAWLLSTSAGGVLAAVETLLSRSPVLPLVLLVAVPSAVVAVVTRGGMPRAAVAAGVACVVGDLTLLAAVLPAGVDWGRLTVLAVAVSCLRAVAITTATARCVRLLRT